MASNLTAIRGFDNLVETPALGEKPTMPAVEVRTQIDGGGVWTIRIVPVAAYDTMGQHDLRYNVTAMYVPTGAKRASRVVKKEKLTEEAARTFNPAGDFKVALSADHRHARAIRETLEGNK